MLLLDMSGIIFSAAIETFSFGKQLEMNLNTVRHIMLSQILYYKKKFSEEYGYPIMCFDGRHYWRKQVFPYYKQNRKKSRDSSKFDWNSFFPLYETVSKEIGEILPYYSFKLDEYEADDLIAVLTFNADPDEKIMIVSADKDLIQLQMYNQNVSQYSPKVKRQLTLKGSGYNLVEHIIRGDASDGIPNMFSDDDTFLVKEKRQKRVTAKKIDEALGLDKPEHIANSEDELNRFYRNKKLIDLTEIPDQDKILKEWKKISSIKKKASIRPYFIKNRLANLMENIQEFY